MEEKNGCFNWIGFIAFLIALYIWVNNVDTVQVVEQIPPSQESWSLVYPLFRDDVSAQLLNTQRMTKGVLDETAYLKEQNAELQYSVDLLLNNLGILKKESYEESIKQRNEQRITTVLSIILGWLLGAFVTKDSMKEIRKKLSQQKTKEVKNYKSSNGQEVKSRNTKNSPLEHTQKESLPQSQSNVSSQRLPQAFQLPESKLCPKCGVQMEIQIAPSGKSKGKKFFVCPNFKQCKQVLPVS